MALAVYRVLPSSGEWQVERDGFVRSLRRHKSDAVYVARLLALACEPSQVVVERADGSIETQWSYDRDSAERPRLKKAV
jgi:hypothetical protein